MKTGLTLGKFAPLHLGHQRVIDRALAQTDHLIVIVYDAPETTTVPLPVRAGWIRTLYPTVEVLEAWDGPTIVGSTPEIMERHDDYLRKILDGRTITHFFSSEFYGEHVSKALGAVDCRVDETRTGVPISGTAIRTNPFTHRQFLSPEVYRDLVTRVAFLGAPSTGKTTIAKALAHTFKTCWMPEYGRSYWETHQQDRRLSPEQLVEIAEGHLLREETLILDANRFLFVDTNVTTTFMFARWYHGRVHPRLAQMADESTRRYDLVFLCDDDIPYDDTWDRSGFANRTIFQKQTRADLLSRHIPFLTLSGTLDARIEKVSRILEGFDKYASLGDLLRGPEAPRT
ncbi:AAA family ATPase [Tautonia marina]|uniref:AAA family ATPase n=1 Tax=Tautonia marina TaxID=2653855 RepID=UPI0012608854|nr:AAA family ATPase [Tautonia marina]